MKTRILFALFLAPLLFSHAQCPGSPPAGITCIPDTNFETELVNQGIDTDGLVNGQVATADINDETSLVVVAKGITDLTGIEDFTSLELLNVSSNALGTLDVSSNTSLIELYSSSCQLTSLILPTTTTLLQVHCVNNFLTGLDVTGIPNVEWLEIPRQTGAGYGTLNLQNNTMLTTLDCYDAGLNSLDVSNNTALSALRVEENNLSTLDLSNNTLLQIIDVDFNPLTELDVSSATQLWSFSATWGGFQNINIKNGNNNLITSLDVTNNPMGLCIQVDVVPPVNEGSWNKDASATYMVNCPGLGVENNVFSDLTIFPNPSKNAIFFDSKVSGDFSIYNIKGQLLYKGDFKSGYNDISTSSLSSGTYILKLKSDNETTTKRIIKTF